MGGVIKALTLKNIAFESMAVLCHGLGSQTKGELVDTPAIALRQFQIRMEVGPAEVDHLAAGFFRDKLWPAIQEMAQTIKIELGGQHPLQPLKFIVRRLQSPTYLINDVFTVTDASLGWCMQVHRLYDPRVDRFAIFLCVECAPVPVVKESFVTVGVGA